MSDFIIIQPQHVGKPLIFGWGRQWRTSEFIGNIMWSDVGKRVYKVDDHAGGEFLQVENEEQFYRRVVRERRKLATFCVRYEQDMSDAMGRVVLPYYVFVDATSEAEAFNKVQGMAQRRFMHVTSMSVISYSSLQEARQEYIYNKGKSGLREVF